MSYHNLQCVECKNKFTTWIPSQLCDYCKRRPKKENNMATTKKNNKKALEKPETVKVQVLVSIGVDGSYNLTGGTDFVNSATGEFDMVCACEELNHEPGKGDEAHFIEIDLPLPKKKELKFATVSKTIKIKSLQ